MSHRLNLFRKQLLTVGASAAAWYARFLARKLFADQLAWCLACEYAVDCALNGRPGPSELLLIGARQTGKNESDGAFTVRGLCKYGATHGGDAIKSAPTHKPQITVSKRRLRRMLNEIALMAGIWETEEGYIFRFLKACIAFMSAAESANRVGATADLWLTIDECQNTSIDVFDRDFSPMRAFKAVPAFYMGTAWTEDCMLAVNQRRLEILQELDGIQRVFRVPWDLRAMDNPKYGEHVEKERDRLGEHHPIYLSQYCLIPLTGLGKFLSVRDLDKLFDSDHLRLGSPRAGVIYVGGVDYSGAGETPDAGSFDLDRAHKRDSTVALVGELYWREQLDVDGRKRLIPCLRIVDMRIWQDRNPEDCTDDLDEFFFVRYRCLRVTADAVGVGDGPSQMLYRRRPAQVTRLKSGAPDVTRVGFRLQGAISSNRFKWWRREENARPGDWDEARLQFRLCEAKVNDQGQMKWAAPTKQQDVNGKKRVIHDDIPRASGYTLESAYEHLASFQNPDGNDSSFQYWDETAGMAA